MDTRYAVERLAQDRHQVNGTPCRTWDIFHVWVNGEVRSGVTYRSTVHAYAAVAGKSNKANDGKGLRCLLWVPGTTAEEEVFLPWNKEEWRDVGAWGIASIVLVEPKLTEKVPIHFFWELSAGKA